MCKNIFVSILLQIEIGIGQAFQFRLANCFKLTENTTIYQKHLLF